MIEIMTMAWRIGKQILYHHFSTLAAVLDLSSHYYGHLRHCIVFRHIGTS